MAVAAVWAVGLAGSAAAERCCAVALVWAAVLRAVAVFAVDWARGCGLAVWGAASCQAALLLWAAALVAVLCLGCLPRLVSVAAAVVAATAAAAAAVAGADW